MRPSMNGGGRRLAEIVADRAEHDRHLLRILEVVDAARAPVDHEQRVDPDVPFRVPLGFLRAADERVELGKQPLDDRRSSASAKPIDGRARAQQQLLDLSPDALGGQVVERNAPAQRRRAGIERELEPRGELDARAARAGCRRRTSRASTARSSRPLEISAAVERIDVLVRSSGSQAMALIVKSRRRAASAGDSVGIALDGEALVSAAGLRLAPRQRDVETGDLVDGEALADGIDAAEPRSSAFSDPASRP